MRLWLMLTIVLPGAWAVTTWINAWPTAYANDLGRPEVGLAITLVGIGLAWLIERGLSRANGERTTRAIERRARREVSRTATEEALREPEERLIAWDGTPMPLFSDRMRRLKVDMPEPRMRPKLSTATPAPHR